MRILRMLTNELRLGHSNGRRCALRLPQTGLPQLLPPVTTPRTKIGERLLVVAGPVSSGVDCAAFLPPSRPPVSEVCRGAKAGVCDSV